MASAVLLSVQRFEIPSLGLSRRFWGAYQDGLWIHIVRHTNMGADDALIPLLGHGRAPNARGLISIALDGHGFAGAAGRSLLEASPGDVFLHPGRRTARARLEPRAGPSFSINIEIDRDVFPGLGGGFTFERGRVARVARANALAEALCDAIEDGWANPLAHAAAEGALAELFAFLRAEGLPVPFGLGADGLDARSLRHRPPPSLALLSRAVDVALSGAGTRAMLIDVEHAAGLSARTLQRGFPALCARWGQEGESFRSHVQRVVLARACWTMIHPRATTEGVARAVGFSTPNAFCRAMATRGLPSPGSVRGRFAGLT